MDVSDDSDVSDSMSETTIAYKRKHNLKRATRRAAKLALQTVATLAHAAVDDLKLKEAEALERVAYAEAATICALEDSIRARLLTDTLAQLFVDGTERALQDADYAQSEASDAATAAADHATQSKQLLADAVDALGQIRTTLRQSESKADEAETAASRKYSNSAWRA